MEQNKIISPIIIDNSYSMENNSDSNDVPNNIIEDIINIDLPITDIIKTEEDVLFDRLCDTLDRFEANELPTVQTIDLTNDSSEDEQDEQTMARDNCIPVDNLVLKSKFLKKKL